MAARYLVLFTDAIAVDVDEAVAVAVIARGSMHARAVLVGGRVIVVARTAVCAAHYFEFIAHAVAVCIVHAIAVTVVP